MAADAGPELRPQTKPAFENSWKPQRTFESAVSQREVSQIQIANSTDEPKPALPITMASPQATDQVAMAVFEAASRLHEAIEVLRGLHDDEARASGPAQDYLRDDLNLVIEAAGSSLVAAHGISALAEARLAALGELAAAEVASNRKDDSVALSRRLPLATSQPDRVPACRVLPILITKDTIRNSVRQHWYDEESPSMALELRVRVEPPFSRLWRSVAAYFDTIRDAINEECDSVERSVGTNTSRDTDQPLTAPSPHTPSRPASDDMQPRGLGRECRRGQALPTAPTNPAATPPPVAPTILDSRALHRRYPHATSSGTLSSTSSPLASMQQDMNHGQTWQNPTGPGYPYRNAPLPTLATPQPAAASTTPRWTGFDTKMPPPMATPTPSTRQLDSPVFAGPSPSLASHAEGTKRPQHQHQYQDAHAGTRSYGVLDNRPALFPPSRPPQTAEGQSGQHRDQTTLSQQATGKTSKESRYKELRQGIMAKHNSAGPW